MPDELLDNTTGIKGKRDLQSLKGKSFVLMLTCFRNFMEVELQDTFILLQKMLRSMRIVGWSKPCNYLLHIQIICFLQYNMLILLKITKQFSYLFMYLKSRNKRQRGKESEWERERLFFHLPMHSPKGCNKQGWARQKPGALSESLT